MDPNQNVQISVEIKNLQQTVESTNMPQDLKVKIHGLIARLQMQSQSNSYSKEFDTISSYIKWITSIPWSKYSVDKMDLGQAYTELEKNHYGLQSVKDRLLEYLAVLTLNKNNETAAADINQSAEMKKLQGASSHAPVLCFVGIQGVGKTTMAKSIANALEREFIRIPLGGMSSVQELRGVSKSEVDAEPGQLIKALVRAQTFNPIILLDEIDKTNSQTGLRADIMASLLEILDPEQNSAFTDKYIDYPVDLSRILFITTANNLGGISAALQDRLEIIRFGSYSDTDKIQIAKNYLLNKVKKASGLRDEHLTFDDNVWPLVVRPLGFDAGVRQLERTLATLCRKVALQIVKGTVSNVHITPENFRQYIPEQIGILS